jgi:hypothetical protein
VAVLRNTYFNCLTEDGSPVAWEPPSVPDGTLTDSIYFGAILAELDARLETDGLTFYVTQDLEQVPTVGRDVVVINLGDEFTRVPRYAERVRAIFKNYAIRPVLTANPLRVPSLANVGTFVWYLRTWAYHAPEARRYRANRRAGRWSAPIWRVPVGVVDQVPLPLKALGDRTTDLFFGGSVGHAHGAGIKERINPKGVAREEMVHEAEALARRRPELTVELVTTAAFADSMDADAASYSRKLMDSRIALVPRGTGIDTFRFWQAVRFGCVPVVDAMPSHPHFFDDAPVVRVSRWRELEDVVLPLLADEERLARLHEQALDWWRTRGSEQAVAAYMAARLNGLES